VHGGSRLGVHFPQYAIGLLIRNPHAESQWLVVRPHLMNRTRRLVSGPGFSRAEKVPSPAGFSPCPQRLKPSF
jgi:hypothetical protein